MTLNKELLEIKTSLAALQGGMNTLHSEMRSGDKLITQIVENQMNSMNEYRRDLKDAIKEFRDAVSDIKDRSSGQISAVRVDLEAQLVEHEQSSSPHDTTLGSRVEKLEHAHIRQQVIVAIIMFLGWGGIAAIIKFIGN